MPIYRIDELLGRDTLYAARIARSILWEKSRSIHLNDFVAVSQT